MRYVLCLFCPPLVILFCGKPVQAILNVPLCLFFWVPAVIHAIIVVADECRREEQEYQQRYHQWLMDQAAHRMVDHGAIGD